MDRLCNNISINYHRLFGIFTLILTSVISLYPNYSDSERLFLYCIKIFIKLTVHSCTKQHVHHMKAYSCAPEYWKEGKSPLNNENSGAILTKQHEDKRANKIQTYTCIQTELKWPDTVKLKSDIIHFKQGALSQQKLDRNKHKEINRHWGSSHISVGQLVKRGANCLKANRQFAGWSCVERKSNENPRKKKDEDGEGKRFAGFLSGELDYESDEKALCELGNCWELKSWSSLTRFLMSVLTCEEKHMVVREAVWWKPDSKLTFSMMLTIEITKNSLRTEDLKSILCGSAHVFFSLTNTISQQHCQHTHCCACSLYRSPAGFFMMIHFLSQI